MNAMEVIMKTIETIECIERIKAMKLANCCCRRIYPYSRGVFRCTKEGEG